MVNQNLELGCGAGKRIAIKTAALGMLAALIWAAPALAQEINWDGGQDLARQFNAQKKARGDAGISNLQPVPVAPQTAPGSAGLMINATEIGVGKFHRYDNKVHHYPAHSAWVGHITPDGDLPNFPIVFDDPDGYVTIQFSNLEELLQALVALCQRRGAQVAVLNIHGHGMPGGMWYPKDKAQKKSAECRDWNRTSAAPDQVNYDQYYSPVTKEEIDSFAAISQSGGHDHYSCITGAPEWREVAGRIPNIKSYFADDAQIHFESCLVGLGPVGEEFTKTVGELLLSGSKANVQTSLNFGLGDWSMPEGMGFWGYLNDAQLEHDNQIYPVDRQDREIRQKGTIRLASHVNGAWETTLVGNQDFMLAGREPLQPEPSGAMTVAALSAPGAGLARNRNSMLANVAWNHGSFFNNSRSSLTTAVATNIPDAVRIPGTNVYAARFK